MATNNDGHLLDSSGQVAVDFVWGNFPAQPNDQRTENVKSNFGGSTGDTGWAQTTYATPSRLDFNSITKNLNNGISQSVKHTHEIIETAWSGYPAYTKGVAKYNITQVDGNGTTVTYQCQNNYAGGETVDITGCSGFNLTSATIAKATADYFTVTNSTAGSLININNGIVTLSSGASASDGSYVNSVAYATVPALAGLTEALATDALLDAGLVKGTVTTSTAGATADNAGTVKSQSVAAGAASIALGTSVNIVLYSLT